MNANQLALNKAIAHCEAAHEAAEVTVAGITFAIRQIVVNRKCYDNEPTPTLQIKANGKRISIANAFKALA
jgi:hypothetical protein